jgi:outer membrane protein assembly factor BamE (lipoprotein component of BamABCDE complex)
MSNKSFKDQQTLRKFQLSGFRFQAFAVLIAGGLLLGGCTEHIVRQGHLFQEEDLAQIHPGMGKDQVILALGTPDTQSTAGASTFYYISQTANQPIAFMRPQVTDRRIVAVYFNNKDHVEEIANYGLKDGKVFDFIKRQTPTYTKDQGVLQELFRNIGAAPALPGSVGGGNKGPGS